MRTRALGLMALLLVRPALAQGPPAAPAKGPRIAVEPASFDFGQVLKNKDLVKEFYLRNFGSQDLVIARVSTTCGCTAALLNEKDKVIKPGGSAALQVKLRTLAPGRLQKSVLIKSNDPAQGLYELKLLADVVDAEK